MKKFSQSGVTLMELMIALTITAFIGLSFIKALSIGLKMWRAGTSELNVTSDIYKKIPVLDEKILTAKTIESVSLANENQGHIKFSDFSGTSVTVFLNTIHNQTTFEATNVFDSNNLMVVYQRGELITKPEIIVESVSSFNVITFAEEPSFFQVVTPSNTESAPAYDAINSIKYFILKTDKGKPYLLENMLQLARAPVSFASEVIYGNVGKVALSEVIDEAGYALESALVQYISEQTQLQGESFRDADYYKDKIHLRNNLYWDAFITASETIK